MQSPKASVCLVQLSKLAQILIDLQDHESHSSSKVDEEKSRKCFEVLEASSIRLLQPRLDVDLNIFSMAVLFNMRAGRHFVECMFLKHHLGAVIQLVTERRLHDFTCMLKWIAEIQQRSPELSQNDKNERMVSLQLAMQGRDIVFDGSEDSNKKLLLLISATLEIAIALRHQLQGQVQVMLQDDPLPESEEHIKFLQRVIQERASQIEGEVRQLLRIVGVQTLQVLLESTDTIIIQQSRNILTKFGIASHESEVPGLSSADSKDIWHRLSSVKDRIGKLVDVDLTQPDHLKQILIDAKIAPLVVRCFAQFN
jgi:hypothetical protein